MTATTRRTAANLDNRDEKKATTTPPHSIKKKTVREKPFTIHEQARRDVSQLRALYKDYFIAGLEANMAASSIRNSFRRTLASKKKEARFWGPSPYERERQRNRIENTRALRNLLGDEHGGEDPLPLPSSLESSEDEEYLTVEDKARLSMDEERRQHRKEMEEKTQQHLALVKEKEATLHERETAVARRDDDVERRENELKKREADLEKHIRTEWEKLHDQATIHAQDKQTFSARCGQVEESNRQAWEAVRQQQRWMQQQQQQQQQQPSAPTVVWTQAEGNSTPTVAVLPCATVTDVSRLGREERRFTSVLTNDTHAYPVPCAPLPIMANAVCVEEVQKERRPHSSRRREPVFDLLQKFSPRHLEAKGGKTGSGFRHVYRHKSKWKVHPKQIGYYDSYSDLNVAGYVSSLITRDKMSKQQVDDFLSNPCFYNPDDDGKSQDCVEDDHTKDDDDDDELCRMMPSP